MTRFEGYRWIQFKQLIGSAWDVAWDLDNRLKNEDRMGVPRILEAIRLDVHGWPACAGEEKTIACFTWREGFDGNWKQYSLEWISHSQDWIVFESTWKGGLTVPDTREECFRADVDLLETALWRFYEMAKEKRLDLGLVKWIEDPVKGLTLAELSGPIAEKRSKKDRIIEKYGSEWT